MCEFLELFTATAKYQDVDRLRLGEGDSKRGYHSPIKFSFALPKLFDETPILIGSPRVGSLRRLARRADVAPLTVFISAVVQAEQVGASVAGVLRRQADDLRLRRRERALAVAATLPVKLLFPLVICFLPAIFTFTLGPTFYQFFQFVDSVIRNPVLARPPATR